MNSALDEFDGAFLVTDDCIRNRSENARTRIVRIQLEMDVDELNLPSIRSNRVVFFPNAMSACPRTPAAW